MSSENRWVLVWAAGGAREGGGGECDWLRRERGFRETSCGLCFFVERFLESGTKSRRLLYCISPAASCARWEYFEQTSVWSERTSSSQPLILRLDHWMKYYLYKKVFSVINLKVTRTKILNSKQINAVNLIAPFTSKEHTIFKHNALTSENTCKDI